MPDRPLREFAERSLDLIYRYRLRPTRGFDYVNSAAVRVTGTWSRLQVRAVAALISQPDELSSPGAGQAVPPDFPRNAWGV